MSDPKAGCMLRRLALEAGLWSGAVAAFLFFYTRHLGNGLVAVVPHLDLLATLLGMLVCLRVASRWLPGLGLQRWFRAMLTAGALGVLLIYYALVLIGLDSWGRVISWALIETYAGQASDLAAILGVSAPLAVAVFALAYAVSCFFVDSVLTRDDWCLRVTRTLRTPVLVVAVVAGLAVCAIRLHTYVSVPPVRQQEPVSLTLFPELVTRKLQSNSSVSSTQLAAAAEEDRRMLSPQPKVQRRNVILVVADALRSDRMGIYGYERNTTPYLATLSPSARTQRAERMVAACSESWCGLLAIARAKHLHQFSERDIPLHEVLRKNGYWIDMILGGDHTNFYGLRDAYGPVDRYVDGSMAKGFYINDDRLVLDQIERLPPWDGRPTMLQLHLMSSHPLGTHEASPVPFHPAAPYISRRGERLNTGTRTVDNHYDNGVAQVDWMLQRITVQLEKKGYLQNSLLVLTADHGEMLGEHGEFGHSKGVHESVLRVPFILQAFGYEPKAPINASAPASQIDIAPTILYELGIQPPKSWAGMALQDARQRPAIHFQQGHRAGLYDFQSTPQIKYWKDAKTGDEFAFDIASDPSETQNLIPTLSADHRRRLQLAILPALLSMAD